ncbi:FAD dependent oxidoreductase [Hyaloscypha variabilis F]|uniref:FAD dependent oxidoreductase n=1 Tax=Hyaloscypha variabilis (strain UAMH 11265 / GT02V1 / F) TaxID=1149755 RepID=A0A2J6SCH5_HYAVF|nr:FAD dependent oxidoreductase [Hyaloscypha variabilis F]
MDARSAIPVTLPRANPTISYWQEPPDPEIADYLSSKQVPEIADTVIIGSGITGTFVAWNLLQTPDHGKIVMLEARQACSGATGRNGGHTKGASYRSFHDNAHSIGTEEAIKIARLEYDNIKAVHAFAREHNIDCDLFSGDTVDIIYDQAQWDTGVKSIEAMRKAMPELLDTVAGYKIWSKEEAKEKFYAKGEECVGAISYEAGSLSAYKFVIGVLKMVVKSGLELFTNTPATKVEKREDGTWSVQTSRGVVIAKRVVLATNGYTGFLCEKFQGKIVPLRGQITAHRPGTNQPVSGLPTTYSFIYKNGYEYMIPRPQGTKYAGDIIMGGGLVMAKDEGLNEFGTTDDTTINEEISSYLTATTPRYFGSNWGDDHEDSRIRKQWTGIMGYSPDGFPFIGEVPGEKNLWMAASFQGHGMVLCFLCARALVAMMGGEEEKLASWFPEAFKVSEERLKKKFAGRLHTKHLDIETKP